MQSLVTCFLSVCPIFLLHPRKGTKLVLLFSSELTFTMMIKERNSLNFLHLSLCLVHLALHPQYLINLSGLGVLSRHYFSFEKLKQPLPHANNLLAGIVTHHNRCQNVRMNSKNHSSSKAAKPE